MRIVDVHTHAFPDGLADRALEALTDEEKDCVPVIGGTVGDLIESMDKAEIEASVVANIATKPKQLRSILDWSKLIQSDRIIPFISLHPDSEENEIILDEATEAGIKGVKIHNLYQGFAIDDPRMIPLYEAVAERNLILLFHAGKDPAYEECESASPERILRVHKKIPRLRIVAAHFGGWRVWNEVQDVLAGQDIYFDISSTLGDIEEDRWTRILEIHSPERVLFGTDSPWLNQKDYLDRFQALPLPDITKDKILSRNAFHLLDMA